MLDWSRIEHLHAIKKIRHIVKKWYGVEVAFFDERGKVQNGPVPFLEKLGEVAKIEAQLLENKGKGKVYLPKARPD